MSSRMLVVGLVALGVSLIVASNGCDPFPDECDESHCDGNTGYFCDTVADRHSIEQDGVTCPADTTCFVATHRFVTYGPDVYCGRLQADGTSCTPGATSCVGDALRTCEEAKDGKRYWLDATCQDRTGSLGERCTPKADGTGAECKR